jgi:hypothetical protein
MYIKSKELAERENATPDETLQRFSELIKTLTHSEDMDKYIEDFPEQYQCRLFYSLLKDPVKLPTSNSIVERAHIHSYLLGD